MRITTIFPFCNYSQSHFHIRWKIRLSKQITFLETNQEVVDLHVLGFKLAEKTRLPVMVNMDGFTLGGRGDDDKFSHIIVAAVLLLNSAIDASYAAKMTAIHNFSKLYYGTP